MKRVAIIALLLCLISSVTLATEMNWLKVTGKATFKDDVQIGPNTIDEISTDGTLGGNSDNAVPTEKAVRTFVESKTDAEFFVDSVDSDLPNAKVLDLGQGLEWVTTGSGKNIACKISSSTELGIAKSSDTGNITINSGDWSLNLNSGDSYTNFGDSDDDTINELFEAIDNAWPGGGSGTSVELDFGNDGSLESTAITRISTTGDTNSIFTEPSDDKLLIDASKNWPTADVANAGDSATAFFSSGTIEHERGGLEADVSAYDGLVKISGGVTSAVTITSAGEAILDDADNAAQRATLGVAIGVDVQQYDNDLDTLSSPDAWKLFYSNGSQNIAQLGLGSSGQVLRSSGASSAPSWVDLDGADMTLPQIGSATYPTVEDWFVTTQSTGKITGGDITDNGDGTIDVSAGSGWIRSSDSGTAQLYVFDWSAASSVSLTDNIGNYILVDYNGGSPQITTTTTLPSDHNTKILLGEVYRAGTDLHIVTAGQAVGNLGSKVFWKSISIYGKFQYASGLSISEKTDRKFALTAGSVYAGLTKISLPSFDSSGTDTFTYYYRDGAGGWTKITGQTQIDNLHYDDGSGTLATLSSGGWFGSDKYGVHWVYEDIDGHVFVVYGQGNYTLARAQDAQPPGSIPDLLAEVGGIVGKIIIQKNDTSFTSIQSAFDTQFHPTAVLAHNDLANIQGGTADEYYHLTQTEHDAVSNWVSGTVPHERGGLEADVSAYDGLVAISGGATSEISTSGDLAGIISDETGTGALVFGTNPTFTGGITLSGADADPTATGQIVYDSTVAGMAGGALRWCDNDSVRLIVDLETDPSDDDYVVAYDADADGFYLKEDSTGAGSSPGGADTNVQFNDGGTFGGQSDFIFEKADSYLGVGTSDATAELDVASSAPTARLKGLSTSYASNAKLGEIQFTAVGPSASEGVPEVTAKIRAEAAQSWSSTTTSSRIEFWITPWNTNTEEEVFMIQPMSGGARFRFGSGGHQPATAILEIYDDTAEGDTLYVRKSNDFYNKSSFVSNNNYDVYHTFIEGTTYFSYGIDASYDRFRMTGTANVSSSQILMIDPDGGIVIGEDETTPDTDSVLELEHEDGANFLITRWDSSTYADDLLGSISFAATDGGTTGNRNEGAAIRVYAIDNFSSTDSASKIEFWTAGSSSTTLTRRWVINGAHFREDAESNAFIIPRVYSDNATTFPAIYFGHARGTIASPSVSQDGDILGRVATQGYDGSAFASAAYITMKAAQNWSGSARASKIVFSTNGTGESAPDDTMEISGDNGLRLMENDKNGTSYQAAAAGKYRVLYVDENGYVVVGDTDKANND